MLTGNGHAEVSCAASDIGTGTYTVMAQVAADMLGLPIDNITVKLGDSTLPQSQVEGGSWTAASVAHAIATRRADPQGVARAGAEDARLAARGLQAGDVVLSGGMIADKEGTGRAVSIADAMRHGKAERIEQEARLRLQGRRQARAQYPFGDLRRGEGGRATRRHPRDARRRRGRGRPHHQHQDRASQIMGSVVWGIGMALHEETLVDHNFGRIMNANIAEYHVPVNADVHDIKVIFVDEPDNIVNPLGIKGVGEIGIVGVAAAIANAIYHATGKRVRDLPITLDKIIGLFPSCGGLFPVARLLRATLQLSDFFPLRLPQSERREEITHGGPADHPCHGRPLRHVHDRLQAQRDKHPGKPETRHECLAAERLRRVSPIFTQVIPQIRQMGLDHMDFRGRPWRYQRSPGQRPGEPPAADCVRCRR